MSARIAITGLGIVSPFGTELDVFRDRLATGASGVAPLTRFDIGTSAARLAASVDGFDPTRWIALLKLRRMDTTSQYAVAAARQALDAAGLPYGTTPDDGLGIALGTYTAGGAPTEDFLSALFAQGPVGAPALIFNATVGNIAATLVGLELRLRGPNVTISQKEVSGVAAIAHAADLVRAGQARAMIAGGVDALFPLFYRVHDRFRVLSSANRRGLGESEGSRPFDETRNGFVLGEGGFALVLEEREAARSRGATVIGELVGTATGGAPASLNQWPSEPAAIVRTLQAAIADAGLTPDDIDVVYASANSSVGLDRVEAAALAEVFNRRRTAVTTVKGALGESGAAGAAAAVAAIVCGRAGLVPPVAGLQRVDPECDALDVVGEVRRQPARTALVNAVASGGALTSLVLRVEE